SVEDDTEKQEDATLHNEESEEQETEEAEETTTSTLENETPETDKQGISALSKLKKKPNLLIFGSVALVVLLVGLLVLSMGKRSEKKAIERLKERIRINIQKD